VDDQEFAVVNSGRVEEEMDDFAGEDTPRDLRDEEGADAETGGLGEKTEAADEVEGSGESRSKVVDLRSLSRSPPNED
jgi:hypothetical protein